MHIDTHDGRFLKGAPRRARALALQSAAALIVVLAACGDSAPTVPKLGTVDTSTLVGSWKGTVYGVEYGLSVITDILKADSTMSGEAENPLYCKVTGTWTASTDKITMVARDCTGTIITSVAPRDPLRMTGTWSATSGKVGTFNIAKEPNP